MIKFSLSLSEQGQTVEARRKIVDFLSERGFEETGSGHVTLSFVAELEAFDEVFQSSLHKLSAPLPRGSETIGASAPFDEPKIKIPVELDPFIDHVSITPPARHFNNDS